MSGAVARLNASLQGRYTLERQIGEGGMATVYLAHDVKHERKVALKVLKPELAAVVGAERFLAEIKTTANLQHPHILPLFDSGQADGFLFYVMPYVEGETLRDKLDREHQLPVDEAVGLTTNVAEALDYAHSRGVIHRDIKPANILLHAGKPVLSDFGIALAVGAAGGGRMTETGLSLGTPHYMSPEQATGDLSVGATTDIYALGCVLFETLVGEPPYTGGTAQAILGKIIAGEPASASGERPSIPANVDAAIHKALEKVPADRFATAGAFAHALATPEFRHGPEMSAGALAPRRGLWNPLSVSVTALAGLLLALLGWSWSRPAPSLPVTAMEIRLGDEGVRGFGLAPDGSFILYGDGAGGADGAFVRPMSSLDAERIPVNCCRRPEVSPDGQSFLDFSGEDGEHYVASITAGTRTRILPDALDWGWGADGSIYFTRDDGGLYRLTEGDSEPVHLTDIEGDVRLSGLSVLPGGKGILAVDEKVGTVPDVLVVVSTEDGTVTPLFEGLAPRYVDSGHLVFVRPDGEIMATPFDVAGMRATGSGVPIGRRVTVDRGRAMMSIAENGTLLYQVGGSNLAHMVRVGRDGSETYPDPEMREDFGRVSLSPDGTRLATSINSEGGSRRLVIKSLPDGPLTPLTSPDLAGAGSTYPSWDTSGEWVYFGRGGIWRVPSDGSRAAEPFFDVERSIAEAHVVGDGTIILRTFPGEGSRDILVVAPGDSVPRDFVSSDADENGPVLSPDGRWLAYVSNGSGRDEVFVRSFPAGDALYPVSSDGGTSPKWAHSGRELFFRSGEGDLMSVDVSAGERLQLSFPQVVTRRARDFTRNYEVFPDDQSFLFIEDEGERARFILVLNFFEELKLRMTN